MTSNDELRQQIAEQLKIAETVYAHDGFNRYGWNPTAIDYILRIVATHDHQLIQRVREALPTEWKTRPDRTEPSNRQLGYNDCLAEANTALTTIEEELK